jgi:hypothetical protein
MFRKSKEPQTKEISDLENKLKAAILTRLVLLSKKFKEPVPK